LNSKGKLTLDRLLARLSDDTLLDIHEELSSGIVPSNGHSHTLCRTINKKIDAGTMCINEDTMRKVYLPTLSKMVYREMASRYSRLIQGLPTLVNEERQLRMWEI